MTGTLTRLVSILSVSISWGSGGVVGLAGDSVVGVGNGGGSGFCLLRGVCALTSMQNMRQMSVKQSRNGVESICYLGPSALSVLLFPQLPVGLPYDVETQHKVYYLGGNKLKCNFSP